MFPLETDGYHPPPLADLHWLSLNDSLREAKDNAQMVVVITCAGIIIYHPAPPVHHPPTPVPFPHTQAPSFSLTLSPPPIKTAAQPEASKAGFTQQSSSRENGCCFQVLFAHLSEGDRSGENGLHGMQAFGFCSSKTCMCRKLLEVYFLFVLEYVCSESILSLFLQIFYTKFPLHVLRINSQWHGCFKHTSMNPTQSV